MTENAGRTWVCISLAALTAGASLAQMERQWSRVWGSTSEDAGTGLTVTGGENAFVGGFAKGDVNGQTPPGTKSAVLSRFDQAGTETWTMLWGPSNSSAEVRGLTSDTLGNVYATGQTWDSMDGQPQIGSGDFFLSKIKPDGTREWTRVWGSTGSDQGNAVTLGPLGSIYVAGFARGSVHGQQHVDRDDLCLTKFDAQGTHQWTRMWGGVNALVGYEAAEGVAVSGTNVYVTGFSDASFDGQANAGTFDVVLTRFTTDGVKIWTRLWGASGTQKGYGVAVDGQGTVYVAGLGGGFNGEAVEGGTDPFLMQVDGSGTEQWTRLWGSKGSDMGYGVGLDASGLIYVTGHAAYGSSFEGLDRYDGGAFLSRLNSSGTLLWNARWGSGDTEGRSVAPVGTNIVYVAGTTYGGFDGEAIVGEEDLWLSKWGPPLVPPVITSGPTATNVTTNAFTVLWDSDPAADSRVYIGTTPGVWTSNVYDSAVTTGHSVRVTGLAPDTLYTYKVESMHDGAAVSATSQVRTASTSQGTFMSDVCFLGGASSAFRTDASGNVDRVEFYMNGRLIGTDYAVPFSWEGALDDLRMTPVELARIHSLEARIIDADGRTRTVSLAGSFADRFTERDIRVRFDDPWRRITLYTDTPSLGWTGFPVRVSAWEVGTTSREIYPGEFVVEDTSNAVESVSFRLDGLDRGTAWMMPPDPFRCDWWIDCTGVSTGYHTVNATARTEDGYFGGESIWLRVVQRLPDLRISRTVTRTGSVFYVSTIVSNVGLRAASILSIREEANGFVAADTMGYQPSAAADPLVRYDPVAQSCEIETVFHGGSVGPGRRAWVVYRLVPALSGTAISYGIGRNTTVQYELDGSTYVEEGDPSGMADGVPLDDAVDAAFRSSDYLIVTGPRALYDTFDTNEVHLLLERAAYLASERNGVFGFFDPIGYRRSLWRSGDLCAFGDMFMNTGEELYIADASENKVRAENLLANHYEISVKDFTNRVCFPFAQDIDSGDAMAMGDVMAENVFGGAHTREEVVLAHGDSLQFFAFDYDGLRMMTQAVYSVQRDDGADIAVGDFLDDGGGVRAAEIAVARRWGNIDFYGVRYSGGDPQIYSRERVSVFSLTADDMFAAGHIRGRFYDQLVTASVDEDRIRVYDPYVDSHPSSPPYHLVMDDISPEDGLAVGNVTGDSADEIIFADASEDRVHVIGLDPASGDLETIIRFTMPFDAGDKVLSWRSKAGEHERICFARADHTAGGGATGLDVLDTIRAGVHRSSRYDLDALMEEHPGRGRGRWARRLSPSWAGSGFALILGGLEIIPSFPKSYKYYSQRWHIRYSDDAYASTSEDSVRPELCFARIVGDSPAAMRKSIESALAERIRRASALFLRGYDEGRNGDSDDIDFSGYVSDARGAASGAGFGTRVTRHTPDGYDRTAFAAEADNYDFIYMAGHGNYEHWDAIESGDLYGLVTFSLHRPLVYAASCLTGSYFHWHSLAEAFMESGASAYVGATENGKGSHCFSLSEEFIRRLDEGTIGRALRNAKRDLADDGCVGSPRRARQYNCSVFHLFGDPSIELESIAGRSAGRDVSPARYTVDEYDRTGPLSTLTMNLPIYEVTHTNGLDHVTLPGGKRETAVDRPIVPTWSEKIYFPPGVVVQDVTMTSRGQVAAVDGLTLPEGHDKVWGAPAVAKPAASALPGLWPDHAFDWTLSGTASNATILEITAYPFVYDAQNKTGTFHQTFEFAIASATSGVWITSLQTDQPEKRAGEDVQVEAEVRNETGQPMDVTLRAVIRYLPDASTAVVHTATLKQLRGPGRYRFDWQTDPDTPTGNYAVDAELQDGSGTVLCRSTCEWYLQSDKPEIALESLELVPPDFLAGENVTITARVGHAGTEDVGGLLTLVIEDAAGTQLAVLEREFSISGAGSVPLSLIWSNAPMVARNCRFRAHIAYDGAAEPELHNTSWTNAPLWQTHIDAAGGELEIRWWSLPDRTYDILFSSNLSASSTSRIATNLTVEYPVGTYTDITERVRGFYRVRETW